MGDLEQGFSDFPYHPNIKLRSREWDFRFIHLSSVVASWSKDPSTKCGAVIVRPDRTVCSVGFNGFPIGASDAKELYENRDTKLARVIHAEQNAIMFAQEPLHGHTMYTWPAGLSPSCDRCAAHIIQSGITTVVHLRDDTSEFNERWKESMNRANSLFAEVGIDIIRIPKEDYIGWIHNQN